MSTELDEKDLKILQELVEDAEQTVSAIAAKVKMPRTTVQERIKRLKQLGVIKKFTVQLDHSKLGKPATAFVLVS
ncbi:MAG: winged helix-turn-helix transcriptional regulator, partial [Candidatus Caldarchaeum sp.]